MEPTCTLRNDFRVAILRGKDASGDSDAIRALRELILANDDMYPGIERWLDRKVVPGLKTSERTAYVGYLNSKPVVSAVVKTGTDAKFCHLRIADKLQEDHLGELFFTFMAIEARNSASRVHFTLPESLWQKRGGFFRSFGFESAPVADIQYRLFDRELACSAPFELVWNNAMAKLPKLMQHFSVGGYSTEGGILMSIRPEYAEKILQGTKRVEVRRRFSPKWVGHRVSIYETAPECALVGEATITNVEAGSPWIIWERYASEIGCSRAEFMAYTAGAEDVSAIHLADVHPFRNKVYMTQLSHLLHGAFKPPQSYCELKQNVAWAQAVSVAALLHGFFRPRHAHIAY